MCSGEMEGVCRDVRIVCSGEMDLWSVCSECAEMEGVCVVVRWRECVEM